MGKLSHTAQCRVIFFFFPRVAGFFCRHRCNISQLFRKDANQPIIIFRMLTYEQKYFRFFELRVMVLHT